MARLFSFQLSFRENDSSKSHNFLDKSKPLTVKSPRFEIRPSSKPLRMAFHFRQMAAAIVTLAIAASALAQSPEFEKLFHQGTEAMRSGQLEEAAADFYRATVLAPNFAEGYFNLGLVRLQQDRPRDAVDLLGKALRLKPTLRGANLFAGIALYRVNEYSKAISALQRETRLDALNANAFMWLGVTQLAMGNASAAIVSLDKAAALHPNDVDILYHRGRAHMLVSKESYEQMYKAAPDSWRIHQVLAQSFVEADRLEEAIGECQKAIALRPHEPGLHEELADIYWKQNQLPQAEAEFQSELKTDPESVSSMYKLAVVSIERSRPEAAAELLHEVLRRTPRSAEAHYQLGRAQIQLGSTEEAIHSFRAVITDPGGSDGETVRQSYYQLAQLYRRTKQAEESRAALDTFLRLKQQADEPQAQRLQDKLKRSAEAQPQP